MNRSTISLAFSLAALATFSSPATAAFPEQPDAVGTLTNPQNISSQWYHPVFGTTINRPVRRSSYTYYPRYSPYWYDSYGYMYYPNYPTVDPNAP